MKKIVLLLIVFAGLGAFVYFYEIKGGEERQAAQELEESLLRVTDEEIDALIVQRPGAEPIELRRVEDLWQITAPIQAEVDRFVVDALARDVANARRLRTLEDVSGQMADFGLEEPRLTLTMQAGDRTETVKVGAQDYTGNQMYVQLEGSDEVLITNRNFFTSADKELKEWRSKSVLEFDQDAAQVVEVVRPEGLLRLEREGEQWKLVQPVQDLADESAVSSLLSTVRYARVVEFVEEEAAPESYPKYGLDRPRFELRVKAAGRDEWRTLQLGGNHKKDELYARDTARRTVFSVRDTIVDNFEKDVGSFRDKKIVKVRQDELDRFLLTKGGQVVEVRREGDGFVIAQPESEKGAATAPYRFWYPTTDIKFEELEARPSPEGDPRFQDPAVRLELTTRAGETRVYEFAEHEGAQLARKLEDGRTGRISLADFNKLKGLEAASLKTPTP